MTDKLERYEKLKKELDNSIEDYLIQLFISKKFEKEVIDEIISTTINHIPVFDNSEECLLKLHKAHSYIKAEKRMIMEETKLEQETNDDEEQKNKKKICLPKEEENENDVEEDHSSVFEDDEKNDDFADDLVNIFRKKNLFKSCLYCGATISSKFYLYNNHEYLCNSHYKKWKKDPKGHMIKEIENSTKRPIYPEKNTEENYKFYLKQKRKRTDF